MQAQRGRRTSPREKGKKDGFNDRENTEPHEDYDSIGTSSQKAPRGSSPSDDDSGDPHLTPKAMPIRRNSLSSDSAGSLPPSVFSIPDTDAASGSTARSTSPAKRLDDLFKLQRPVRWERLGRGDLRAWMRSRNALPLLTKLQTSLLERYIPVQLRQVLEDELENPNNEDLYHRNNNLDDAVHTQGRTVHNRKHTSRLLFQPFAGGGADDDESSSPILDSLMQLVSLESERRELQRIITKTTQFIADPHAEPEWNDSVHHPLLELAVRHNPDVAVKNVTRANIARPFMPPANGYVQFPLNSKMIDYTLVLRPSGADDDDRDKGLSRRISRFVDRLSPRTFNQSTYGPLSLHPTGVFIETKVDLKKHPEGQVQLGLWLASWFLRVEQFPLPAGRQKQGQGQQQAGTVPYVLPVLIVVADSWEVWFASRGEADIEVAGPVRLGSTENVEACYRLLAGLRVLVNWMSSDFREWVEGIV
ncbi:hypothetical protein GGS24DRAFT_468232 [Hypoxylon argillaceum]|nr:hypothetical protein GGS24DRAFT_468232 [Hypoxylon argillaceum]